MSGLAKGKVYTYGVSPSFRFSAQYQQSQIPLTLQNSNSIRYISAGKYSTTALVEKTDSTGKIIRRLWGYGDPSST